MDVALRIAYDGSCFRGLARQPEGGTVEDGLLEALRQNGYVEGSLRTGSRTDAGVSALENVLAASFDRKHLRGFIPAVNAVLPAGLWLTGVAPIPDGWRVRTAAARTYHYHAANTGEDLALMQEVCHAFVGTHDFTAFARIEDRPSTRPVHACSVTADGDGWRFEVAAAGFLWNQVRRMVDACLLVGRGKATLDDVQTALETGTPHPSFGMARPEGLVLAEIRYDPPLDWSATAGRMSRGAIDRFGQQAAVRSRLAAVLSASCEDPARN